MDALAAARCTGADGEGHTHVLAGYDSMGTVVDAFWAARRLHLQLATLFPTARKPVLGASGIVFEPRGMFVESGNAHHALRLSAIFTRGQTHLDRWNGAPWHGTNREDEILAGHRYIPGRDHWTYHVVVPNAEHVLAAHVAFRRRRDGDDAHIDRFGRGAWSFVSELSRRKSEQNCQRLWRDVLPGAELSLHPDVHH